MCELWQVFLVSLISCLIYKIKKMMVPNSGFLWELKYILHIDHLAQGLALKEINIFVIILFTLLNMQAILIWMLMLFFCWALFLCFLIFLLSLFSLFFFPPSDQKLDFLDQFFKHLNFSLILKVFLFYVWGDFILILILQMIAFLKHLGISEHCFLYSRNFLLCLVYGWWVFLFSRDFVNLF